jgi:hypothetical protein
MSEMKSDARRANNDMFRWGPNPKARIAVKKGLSKQQGRIFSTTIQCSIAYYAKRDLPFWPRLCEKVLEQV